jgi:peptide/nickel transport system permease protein
VTLAVVCVLALATWVNYARIVRSQVLSIRNQGYVEAARAIGAGVPRGSSSCTFCPTP